MQQQQQKKKMLRNFKIQSLWIKRGEKKRAAFAVEGINFQICVMNVALIILFSPTRRPEAYAFPSS